MAVRATGRPVVRPTRRSIHEMLIEGAHPIDVRLARLADHYPSAEASKGLVPTDPIREGPLPLALSMGQFLLTSSEPGVTVRVQSGKADRPGRGVRSCVSSKRNVMPKPTVQQTVPRCSWFERGGQMRRAERNGSKSFVKFPSPGAG
jgi:hypothetical protein